MPSLKELLDPYFVILPRPTPPYTAKCKGFIPLTYPYILPMEETMLKRAIVQLGTVPWMLVTAEDNQVELWRKKNGGTRAVVEGEVQ